VQQACPRLLSISGAEEECFQQRVTSFAANDSSCQEGSAGQRETIKGFPNWLARSLPNPTAREHRASSRTS